MCRLAVMQTANPVAGEAAPFGWWFTYLVIVVMLVCLGTQVVFLNRAISSFSIHVVTPLLYVEFTALSITASAILYGEFDDVAPQAALSICLGFLVVIVGLFLVSSFRDLKFGWSNWVAYVLELKASDADEHEHALEPTLPPPPPPPTSAAQAIVLERAESNTSTSSDSAALTSAARNGLPRHSALATIAELPSNTNLERSLCGAADAERSPPPPKPNQKLRTSHRSKKRLFHFTLGDRFHGVDTGSPLASSGSGAGERAAAAPHTVRRRPWTLITDLNGYGSRKRALRAVGRQQSAATSSSSSANNTNANNTNVNNVNKVNSVKTPSVGTVDSGFCSEAAGASSATATATTLESRRSRNPFPAVPSAHSPSSSATRDHIAIPLEELPPRALHQVLLPAPEPEKKATAAADAGVAVTRLQPPTPSPPNGGGNRRASQTPDGAIASRVAYNSMPAAEPIEEPVC